MANVFVLGGHLTDLPAHAMEALGALEWYGARVISIRWEFETGAVTAFVQKDIEDGSHKEDGFRFEGVVA